MSKIQKHVQYYLKRAETSVFLMVPSATPALMLLRFLIVSQHESGTRSATVHNKNLSSQINLTDQIEPV